ncbi:leucine-rich repeat-containing protein 61 [Patella vulgata]|uniref:leucine-rich repeat-containing protein 61 n=1 Tax=Patella vulgata TaxID=6465 RepID=UPI00217F72D8|nr:leucine-rich repeat-containing protein 61 [Patella vulgata]
MSETTEGQITKQLLKTRSGEFDVESIHSICLRGAGILDLGCISECSSLEKLDLSKNDISKLHKLAGLNNLAVLNLSGNRIVSLEGLQALENLTKLNLAGNLIGRVGELRCLTGLSKLTDLRLQDTDNGLSNPLCGNNTYIKEVVDLFPSLITLDGERVSGKGSELYFICQQIDQALVACSSSNNSLVTRSTMPENWVPDNYWKLDTSAFDNSNLHDAEQQLEDLLKSCKKMSQEAAQKLQEATLTL